MFKRLARHGDTAWAKVALDISTRNRHQVRAFARSSKLYKTSTLSYEMAIQCCNTAVAVVSQRERDGNDL